MYPKIKKTDVALKQNATKIRILKVFSFLQVVYAELSLAPGETKGPSPQNTQEDTEYVDIVGVLKNGEQNKQ